MSIQGKKIACGKMAIKIVSMIVNAMAKNQSLPSIMSAVANAAVEAETIRISDAVASTPHQHFNAKGEIDKRKVKRHNRKIGIHGRNAYIIKINRA